MRNTLAVQYQLRAKGAVNSDAFAFGNLKAFARTCYLTKVPWRLHQERAQLLVLMLLLVYTILRPRELTVPQPLAALNECLKWANVRFFAVSRGSKTLVPVTVRNTNLKGSKNSGDL